MANIVKVGIFMTAALLVVAYLILKSEDLSLFGPEGRRVDAVFESVAGLDDKSAVRTAGVRVGRVDGIRLEGRRAIVTLLLEEEVPLTTGAVAHIANLGLLGDKYVELDPGSPDAPPLPEGQEIPGEAPPNMDQLIGSLSELGKSLGSVAGQLSGEAPPRGPLGQTMVNLESATAQLQDLLTANREQVDSTLRNFESMSEVLARELPRLAGQIESLVTEVRTVVTDNREVFGRSLQNVEQVTASLQTSVENLNEITGGLEAGEGTIGKLLKSDEAHDELMATLDSVRTGVGNLGEALGRAQRLHLDLAMEGMYFQEIEESRGAFELQLRTASDHRYRLAVVNDPRGTRDETLETITITDPDGTTSTRTIETVTVKDDISFTTLYGLPVHEDFSLWTGLIESRFGVELEYAPQGRWWVSVEAFDFDRVDELDPHLRFSAGLALNESFYLLAGYDDFLTDEYRGLFVGGGLRWSDDDLKYLLGSLPSF